MEKVSQFGKYEGYSEAIFDGYARRSDYLTLADGTRLAYDVLLPTRDGVPATEPLPVLFTHTTYLRALKVVEDGEIIGAELFGLNWLARTFMRLRARFKRDGHLIDQVFRYRWLKRLIAHGYVVVAVERAGTGASSGAIGPSFEDCAREADQVLNWIAAQPWCDGDIGMFGLSMVAMAQYAAASANNPHLKAIFPCAAGFDMYEAVVYPGGVYCTGFGGALAHGTGTLERMIVPVDSDIDGATLAEILKRRGASTLGKLSGSGFKRAPLRDSDSPHPRGTKLWEDMGLYALLASINRSGVAVYNSGGWYDLFARDALLWHVNLQTPKRLHVRPLFHDAMGKGGDDLDYGAEVHRWFDYWLKGIDNGIMDEAPVHYYVVGAPREEAWRTAEGWPPAGIEVTRCYLGADGHVSGGGLAMAPPEDVEAYDAYIVDYTTTSGPAARWGAVLDQGAYPDMRANDAKALTYTTLPLQEDVEIVGHPVVHLWLTTQAPDLDLFVYLEVVDPDGRSTYVTEGNRRASHRASGALPFDHLGLPYHRGCARDVAPLPAGTPVALAFDLLPVARRFRAGQRIRVAITGADADNFETPALDPPPEMRVLRSTDHASYIDLPFRPVT